MSDPKLKIKPELKDGLAPFFNIPAIRPLWYDPGEKFCRATGAAETGREYRRVASLDEWLGHTARRDRIGRPNNIGFDACDLTAELIPLTFDADSREAMELLSERIAEPMPVVRSGSGFRHYHFVLRQETFAKLFRGVDLIPDFKLIQAIKLELLSGTQHRVMPGSRVDKIKAGAMPGADGEYSFLRAGALPIDPPSAIALIQECLAELGAAKPRLEEVPKTDQAPADEAKPDKAKPDLTAHDGGLAEGSGLDYKYGSWRAKGDQVSEGGRNAAIYHLAHFLFRDRQIAFDEVKKEIIHITRRFEREANGDLYPEKELAATVRSALKAIDGEHGEKRDRDAGPRDAKYYYLDRHTPTPSFAKMLEAGGVRLAFNERDESIEIKRTGEAEFRQPETGELTGLQDELMGKCRPRPEFIIHKGELTIPDKNAAGGDKTPPAPWSMGNTLFANRAAAVALTDRRDPVALRLHEIERISKGGREWKGEPIPDDFLFRSIFQFFNPGDEGPDNLEAMKFIEPIIACGIVQNALTPGRKWSWTPALIGPAGIGKSTYAQSWTWDPETEFSDQYTLTPRDEQRAGEQAMGKVVVELPEAQAITRAMRKDANDAVFKGLVTRQAAWRRPYAKLANTPYLFRFVIIITANFRYVVPGQPGAKNRRVLPAHIEAKWAGKDNAEWIAVELGGEGKAMRLAQAIQWIKGGKWPAMINDIEKLMKRLGPSHMVVDELLMGLVLKRLSLLDDEMKNGLPLFEIVERCMPEEAHGIGTRRDTTHAGKLTQPRLANVLPEMDWKPGRRGRSGVHVWYPPADWQERRDEYLLKAKQEAEQEAEQEG